MQILRVTNGLQQAKNETKNIFSRSFTRKISFKALANRASHIRPQASDLRFEPLFLKLKFHTDLRLIKQFPRSIGKFITTFQPPEQRMRVDDHDSGLSDYSKHQSLMGNGSINRSGAGNLDGTPAAYAASTSEVARCFFKGRTSHASRPRSVIISGSPVDWISWKYSSTCSLSSFLETVLTRPICHQSG